MADIFISYSSKDRALAIALAADLEARGYSVWWDFNLIGGRGFREQIHAELVAARAVIVIWTKDSVASKWVRDEADEAERLNKLLPTRVPKLAISDIPLGHRQTQTYLLHERERIYAALAAMGVEPSGTPQPKKAAAIRRPVPWRWVGAAAIATAGAIALYVWFSGFQPPALNGHTPGDEVSEAPRPVQPETATQLDPNRGAKPLTKAELAYLASVTKAMPDFSFKECPECPEMVIAPAGDFVMGSPDGETPVIGLDGKPEPSSVRQAESGRSSDEGPQRRVKFANAFAIGKFEVIFAEWDACVDQGGCSYRPTGVSRRGRQPVIYVDWNDITTQYIPWLNKQISGNPDRPYRLPTEAEWEYAARAGTKSRYWFGDDIPEGTAQHGYAFSLWIRTVPVDSFPPNPWGLYNVHGNVREYVGDCYISTYERAPRDGSAVRTTDDCYRVLRGGDYSNFPQYLRSANRAWSSSTLRYEDLGFRVARTITP